VGVGGCVCVVVCVDVWVCMGECVCGWLGGCVGVYG